MNDDERHTLLMLMLGIFIYFIIASIPTLIFTKDKVSCELGLFIGAMIGEILAWHMNVSIIRAVHMEKGQSAYLSICSVGRLLISAGLIVYAGITGVVSAIFIVVGMLGLKASAYIQPVLEKRFKIKNKK